MKLSSSATTVVALTLLLSSTLPAQQDTGLPPDIQVMTPLVVSQAAYAALASPTATDDAFQTNQTSGLPLWTYQVDSPRNNHIYTGVMVGSDPTLGRSTNIPTVIVPLIFKTQSLGVSFDITTSRIITKPGNTTFDVTAPDACYSAPSNVPLTLFEQSPLLNPSSFNFGGTDVGRVQYLDGFQRSNFWNVIKSHEGEEDEGYHVNLGKLRVLPAITLTVPADQGTTYPFLSCSPLAIVNYGWFAQQLTTQVFPALAQAGVTPRTLPLLFTGNIALTFVPQTLLGCCVVGFHGAVGTTPPFQTFTYGGFFTNSAFGVGSNDTNVFSHEIGEWMDDPLVVNATPPWGHTGQVSGCQGNLEVGDPLSGKQIGLIQMPNGFNYHLQELANFSWFFGGNSVALNHWNSDAGTFLSDAGPVCLAAGAPVASTDQVLVLPN